MENANVWNQVLVWPITNVIIGLYRLFETLHAPGPLGFAIITMTILMRLLLWPLMQAQMESAKKMQKLKPKLDELTKQHKDDKTALSQAQMALYKEHGVNPAAGCLPLIIQMPILIALYNVFHQLLQTSNPEAVISAINTIVYHPWLKISRLDATFFGFDLLTKPDAWQSKGWWLLTIPILTAGLQWYQTKLMLPQSAALGSQQKNEPHGKKQTKEASKKQLTTTDVSDKKDEKSQEDMAADMQKQMAIISPLMFGYFAFQFPVGLALYWNIFSLFGIMHQMRINQSHASKT